VSTCTGIINDGRPDDGHDRGKNNKQQTKQNTSTRVALFHHVNYVFTMFY